MNAKGDVRLTGNAAAPFLMEFILKQKLSKLGYSFDINDLDDITIQAFAMIGGEIEAFMERKSKKD